ncbi:MAG: ABC transporter ATP-binding protein [Candidatus Hodarchaeales archaeon]
MNDNTTILQVSNLTKIYGHQLNLGRFSLGQRVVGARDVSFALKKGEIFGFLGPNGAGKTTTMRAILDYLKIQEGSVTVLGMDHHSDRLKIRRSIGYVPGDMSLFENFTGEELIDFFGKLRPVDPEFLEELRSVFRVKLNKKIKSLSKGNRQQAGIIAIMASKPELLILDEPTSGLDPLMTEHFHELLKKLRNEGVTIFLSSHDLAEVQAICDRIAIIKEGEIVLVETIEDLKAKFLQKITVKFDEKSVPAEEELKKHSISFQRIVENEFQLTIGENISAFLKWISSYEIKRFTCEDASLEEIFLQFYE